MRGARGVVSCGRILLARPAVPKGHDKVFHVRRATLDRKLLLFLLLDGIARLSVCGITEGSEILLLHGIRPRLGAVSLDLWRFLFRVEHHHSGLTPALLQYERPFGAHDYGAVHRA